MRALFALFIRSVREDARARLPPILRAALVLVILLILWANERDFTRSTAPGREFLGMVLFANLGLIAIATLGIFSSAITEEKEDQTLTLLRMTRLSPLAILFGKGTSRLLLAALLLAAQIPFTLLAVTLGGVSLEQVFQGYAVLGATLFFLCNLALLCSVLCRTTLRSGIWTGVLAAILFVVLPIICATTALRNSSPGSFSPQTAWQYFSVGVVEANPVYALAMLIFERSARALPGMNMASHVWINLSAGALCFLLAWLAFDRCCANAGEEFVQRRKGGVLRLSARARRRPSCKRPLAWTDFHFLIGGLRGLLIRFGICVLIFGGAYAFERWVSHSWDTDPERILRDTGQVTMLFALIYFGLDASLLASRIFGDERRQLTLGTLLTLPKHTGWFIRQKLLGGSPVIIPSAVLFGTGAWLDIALSNSDYSLWRQVSNGNWLVISYIVSQALLLPVLIAWLSLKLRRGAMPAGIALMAAMNVLIVVIIETAFRGSNEKWFIGHAAACSALLAVAFAILIHHTLPRVAAAE